MNTFIQTRITVGILTVIPMRKPTVITDCMIRLVSTQQASLAVILTRMSVRMPAEILVSGAAAIPRWLYRPQTVAIGTNPAAHCRESNSQPLIQLV